MRDIVGKKGILGKGEKKSLKIGKRLHYSCEMMENIVLL